MTGGVPPLRFNRQPRISEVLLGGDRTCLVFDDVLAEPEAWVDFAANHAARFVESTANAYPGPELPLPDPASRALDGFFTQHARREMGGRRTLRVHARMAIATRRAAALSPRQWLCHVDRMEAVAGESIAASVLYLFRDPALGGTVFFRPRRPLAEIGALVQDSARMTPHAFEERSGLAAGYMTATNPWFERVAAVAPRFNRLVVYPGSVFHGADIREPERLDADPRKGRLTMNGFFVCRRRSG